MIVGDDGPQVVTLPPTAGPDLTERARRIDLTRVSAESSGSMMLDDAQLLEWRDELDTLLSTAVYDAEVDAVAGADLGRSGRRAGPGRGPPAVHVHPHRPLEPAAPEPAQHGRPNRCTSSSARARRSSRSRPATSSSSSAPDGVTEVVIPVEARSNGTSSLEVAVLTPVFGQEIDEPVVLTARVNALTGLGQVVTGAAPSSCCCRGGTGTSAGAAGPRLALVGEVDGLNGRAGSGRSRPTPPRRRVAPPVEEPAVESLADP